MSSRDWRTVYQAVREMDRTIPRAMRRPEYSDVLMVALYLWSVWHDRPQGWACRRENFNTWFRPRALPSQSRLSRRIRSGRCQLLLQRVYDHLARTQEPTPTTRIDSRPLVVGACSKDRQARAGRVYAGFARGYRLHQIVTEDERVLCWNVAPMNESDGMHALLMMQTAALGSITLADGNYDSNVLYETAQQRGTLLIACIPKNRLKTEPRTARNTPARIAAVHHWKHGLAPYVYRDRKQVEVAFAHQSNYGGGLGPLPAWVRSLERVRRWVGAKLLLHHARLLNRKAEKCA